MPGSSSTIRNSSHTRLAAGSSIVNVLPCPNSLETSNLAAMRHHNVPYHGEPYARALHISRRRRTASDELPENCVPFR